MAPQVIERRFAELGRYACDVHNATAASTGFEQRLDNGQVAHALCQRYPVRFIPIRAALYLQKQLLY